MSEQTETHAVAPVAARRSRSRAAVVYALLVFTGLFLLLSSFAVWVDRVALDTNVFVDTSTELIEDSAIRHAVATRAVDELYASVDVEAEIRQEVPKDLKSLSGVGAAGLREAAYIVVERALKQPALQRLWEASLRESHEELVDVLEGGGTAVSTQGGIVTLDLREIVLDTADRIGIRDQVEDELPAEVGRVEVLRSDELDTAQDAFQLLNTLAWVLPILTLAMFGAAVWAARGKRRLAIRGAGITILVVGVVGLVAVDLVGGYVVHSLVSDTEAREAAGNAWDILTELLRTSFRWMVVVGTLFVVAAWLAGPGRRAVAARRTLAPAVRQRAWGYAGLAVVGLILLVAGRVSDFAWYLIVAVLVALGAAWIELIRGQTLREFPDASGSDFLDETRTRVSSWWETLRTSSESRTTRAAPAGDVTSRLVQLADLHTRGELTDEEYAAAKARVLSGE